MLFNGDIELTFEGGKPPRGGGMAYRSHAEVGGRKSTLWKYGRDFDRVASHEFGHLLGFSDMYTDIPGKDSVAFPGHTNDIMGDKLGSVQWYHARTLQQAFGN